MHASGGPEADLVAAVAPHLALRAVALALREHVVLAERDVVDRALLLGLGLHRVGHALVEASLEAASGHLDLVELRPLAARVVAAFPVGAGNALRVELQAVDELLLLGDLLESYGVRCGSS